MNRFTRAHLAASFVLVCVTATFSIAYFHIDEFFQVLEWTWVRLGIDPAWTLPWEHAAKMRPWMQPFVYTMIARAAGSRDVFTLSLIFRLFTGLASWAALALFVRTTLPWFTTDDEKRLHVRVATLLGFLPYLFVRTSSETFAMASFTAAWAILLEGATNEGPRRWTIRANASRALAAGALLGFAFEVRFQSVFLTIGLVAWLVWVARSKIVPLIAAGFASMIAVGTLVDRWGYGEWTFPAWTYLRTNVLEGAAALFGDEPPFAYAWLLPSNVFLPVVLAMLAFAVLAWLRNPWHPITWATLPFFAAHNLIAHKEERFVFPMAILATAFVTMAIGPSSRGRGDRVARFAWAHRRSWPAKLLVAWSTAMMVLLAFWPMGWNHHVRFQKYVHDALAGDLRAVALPSFDLGLPAFHGPTYDVVIAPPEEIASSLREGTAREWLVADTPRLHTGESTIDRCARLTWSELPWFEHPAISAPLMDAVEAYDARVKAPLRPITFRTLYRLDHACAEAR